MMISGLRKKWVLMCASMFILCLLFLLSPNAVFGADDNSEGGLALEDYMDDLSKMNTTSSGLAIHTTTSLDDAIVEGDTSILERTSGTPYITYKRKDIKSFLMVAYFDPGESMDNFKFYTSSDGTTYTQITPGVYDEGTSSSSWKRIVYSSYDLANADYLKVEWGSSTSTAYISQIRISFTGGIGFSDLGFETTTTSGLTTTGGWDVKYAKTTSLDTLNFNASISAIGGAPGGFLTIGESSDSSQGKVLLGQKVTLPNFISTPDSIQLGVDYQIYNEDSGNSNVLKLVVLPESYWDTLSFTTSGALVYNSSNELFSTVLHNGASDPADVTEWRNKTTAGLDIASSLSSYTGQTVVFVLMFESSNTAYDDWLKIENFELNMGELSNTRPFFVDLKSLRDKIFGYRWANQVVASYQEASDPWLNYDVTLLPESSHIWGSDYYFDPHDQSFLRFDEHNIVLFSSLLPDNAYLTYYETAVFDSPGEDGIFDTEDDNTVSMADGYTEDEMQKIVNAYYGMVMSRYTNAAKNLSYMYLATGNTAYAQKAAEILNQLSEKYPNYELHDLVDPPGINAAKLFMYQFTESESLLLPMTFVTDNIYNSGYLSNSQKEAARDDLLYPAVDVMKIAAYDTNLQVVRDYVIGLVGYLYDDSTLIEQAKGGFTASRPNPTFNDLTRGRGMFTGSDNMIDNFIDSDGVWFEASVTYQDMISRDYIYMIEAAKRPGSNNNENLYTGEKKLELMFDSLLRLAYPNLSLQTNNDGPYNPNLADPWYLWHMELPDMYYGDVNSNFRKFLNDAYDSSIGKQSRGNASLESLIWGYKEIPHTSEHLNMTDMHFKGYGTVITRDNSQPDNRMMTTLDYGAYNMHGHYDKLNITTYGADRIWLDDLGRVSYEDKQPDIYYLSTVGHNTVSVPDARQAYTDATFINLSTTKSMHVSSAYADGMFANVDVYKRSLMMVSPFILDVFKLKTSQSIELDWLAQAVNSTLSTDISGMASQSGALGTSFGYEVLDNLSKGTTSSTWSATFTDSINSDARYKITMLNGGAMDVYTASGPGIANSPTNKIPKLVARKTVNGDYEFIALHESITDGSSQISDIEQQGKIVVVTMTNGQKYYLQYNLEYAIEDSSFGLIKKDSGGNVTGIEVINDNRQYIDQSQYLESSNILSKLSVQNNLNGTIDIFQDELDTTQKTDTTVTFYVGSGSINNVRLDGKEISFTVNGDYVTITAPLRAIPTSRSQSTVLTAFEDASAQQSTPSTNFGSDDVTSVRSFSGLNMATYVKFNLDSYTGTGVESADFKFRTNDTYGVSNLEPVVLKVYGLTDDSWTESGLTWNNAPNISTNANGNTIVTGVGSTAFYLGSVTIGAEQYMWNEITGSAISSFVKDYAFSDKLASFLIVGADDNTYGNWIQIYSKDYVNGTTEAPKLTLTEVHDVTASEATYTRGGTHAASNYGSETTIQVQDNSTDASNDAISYMKFDFSDYDTDMAGKAVLKFHVTDIQGGPSAPLSVYGITDDTWSESSVTWNTSPNVSTILTASEDTFAQQSTPSTNYGSAEVTSVRSFSGNNMAAYIKFDLGSYTGNGLGQATLRFETHDDATPYNPVVLKVYGLTNDTWTENSLTWNNAPNITTNMGGLTTVTGAGTTAIYLGTVTTNSLYQWNEVDVTAFVRDYALGDTTASFMIVGTEDNTYADWITVLSRESTDAPELVLKENPTTTLTASEDTFAQQSTPSTNYGSAEVTSIRSFSGNNMAAYIKFDLESYTGNGLGQATLRFNTHDDTEPYNPVVLKVYGLTNDTWTENSLTWNNAPNITTTTGGLTAVTGAGTTAIYLGTITTDSLYQWNEVDVTAFIRDYALGDTTASFMIVGTEDNTYSDWITVLSKESVSSAPQLVLKGNPVTGVGSNAFKIATVYTDTTGKYYNVDVTDFINTQMTDKIASFILVDETGSNVKVQIASDDASSNQPLLELYKPAVIEISISSVIEGGGYANNNFGTSDQLIVENYDSNNAYVMKSYIKIDMTQIKSRKVNKAILKIRGHNSSTTNPIPVSVYGIIDDTWEEIGVTWNNAPNNNTSTGAVTGIGTSAFLQSTVNIDDTVMTYEFDISDFIYTQLWDDKIASFTLAIVPSYSTRETIRFNSDDASYGPQFVLEY